MIMSLFSVTATLLVFAQSGSTRLIQDAYETEMYPIHLKLTNDRSETKWSMLVPKHFARFINDLLDCSHDHQEQRLEESELKTVFKTMVWRFLKDEIDRMGKKPWYLLRRWNIRPSVEIGPGAFKHDIINFPPETLGKEMKKLLALQTRQENQAKDLNEGNENNV